MSCIALLLAVTAMICLVQYGSWLLFCTEPSLSDRYLPTYLSSYVFPSSCDPDYYCCTQNVMEHRSLSLFDWLNSLPFTFCVSVFVLFARVWVMLRSDKMLLRSSSSSTYDGHGLTHSSSGIIRPLKKRNGVVAGMPRPGGGRNSPIGSNVADGEEVVRQISGSPRNQIHPKLSPFVPFPLTPHWI